MDGESSFGVSHLSGMPITLTFGMVLVFALLVLVFLRIVFGEISVSGGARA
jgi:uncharacterized membrane protein